MKTYWKRLALFLALAPGFLPFLVAWAGAGTGLKTEYYFGKVVPLKEVPTKPDVKTEDGLALVTEDGKAYPLLNDPGARMFFTDEKLRRRPMRLTGRFLPEKNVLQVVNVHSLLKGKLHDIYYWCDICAIKRFQAGLCDCCGDKLEFREVPLR